MLGGRVWRCCIVLTVLASLSGRCDGADERQEVTRLPGQPTVNFKHYAGYVTVNESHGRALFYWFFESSHRQAAQRPLVLWLNGGPGCSSIGSGALSELGPFFTNKSGNGLVLNKNAWTNAANIIFLESPFGTGFSYTETDSDYRHVEDELIAEDAHAFLVGWFKKFPEYAQNEFYLAGESYAGHYVPTLARVIVRENKSPNGFRINFRGFARASLLIGAYDPCLDSVTPYLNLPSVQSALHVTPPLVWAKCSLVVFYNYTKADLLRSMLPVYQELLKEDLRIWIYSGDVDGAVSTLGTRKWIKKLNLPIEIPWYAWNYKNQVGGWTQKYKGLTFASVRGAGHLVPADKPGLALALFRSFLAGQSLPQF